MEKSPINVIRAIFLISLTANLKNHMKVHSGGKSNKCDQCKLATAQAANLRIHIMVHIGVKPNEYDQCNFSTFKTANLEKHMKINSG